MVVTKVLFVYAVKDSRGHVWMGAVDDAENSIHAYGIEDNSGHLREFDGTSYRLPAWCLDIGLQCVVTKRTIEVEFPE